MKVLIPLLLLTVALAAQAQPAAKVYRLGVLFNAVPLEELSGRSPRNSAAVALVEGLEKYGWVPGRNIEIHWRSAEGKLDRSPALIAELVRMPVDVLVVVSEGTTKVALQQTRSIPIVMATSGHPVKAGVVASLARPGGNVTGMTHHIGFELDAKRLALLKEFSPGVTRVGVLRPIYWQGAPGLQLPPQTFATAEALGISMVTVDFQGADQIEGAIDDAVRKGVNALFVPSASALNVQPNRGLIQRAAIRHRLPAMYSASQPGDLVAYAGEFDANYRRVGFFVDRILKGAKPGEIPIEQPSRFELTVDLKAARAIGLTIPKSVLLQADRVVE